MTKKSKVLLICCGVGHINRGYESHMTELFKQLRNEEKFEILLLKGGGKTEDGQKKIFCLKREEKIAKFIEKVTNKPVYLTEQVTFFISSILTVLAYRPDVIYCPDFALLRLYVKLKNIFKLTIKTILCNGGNYKPPYYGIDWVQFILPHYAENVDIDKKVVILHGFDVRKYIKTKIKSEYRESLGLPKDKTIILSVGAINKSVKRMDYIINEVCAMEDDNIYLLLLGQQDEESKYIESLAKQKLQNNYLIETVNYEKVQDYFHASDIFCSASLNETFGKVYVEALLCEVPVISDDNMVIRSVLGEYCHYSDLSKNEALTKMITQVRSEGVKYDLKLGKIWAQEKYGWENLKDNYKKLLAFEK